MKVVKSLIAAAGMTLAALSPALAGPYPDKPVTMVVPFPPGGGSDTTARILSSKMTETLGQSIVIDNRPGATGAIGATTVAQAKPDGYTFMLASIGVYSVNPFLQKGLRYDPTKDFDLLTVAVRTPNVLVASPNFPANSVADLIAMMKKEPDKITFASSGAGSSDHLTAVLFWQKAGVKGVHVPYKGGGPAISDLMGGHADVSFQNLGTVAGHIKSGKLKVLAITADKRAEGFEQVPTFAEAGVADLIVYSWQGVAAPKGLPQDVYAKLHGSIVSALRSPELKTKYHDQGFEVVANSGPEFADFLNKELARWGAVVKDNNITIE